MRRPLQQGELHKHAMLSSYAYLVPMGMACPPCMLFIFSRSHFRMAVEAVTSTSELAYLRLRIVAFLVTLGRPRLGHPTGAPSRE